jgi:hypothetical protein
MIVQIPTKNSVCKSKDYGSETQNTKEEEK